MLQTTREGSSAAADSGIAVGRAIQLWHELGEDPLALDEALRRTEAESHARCPLADWTDVRAWATGYAADTRNGGHVASDFELEVRFPLGRFVLVGHVDQIRRTPEAGARVWDVKSGKAGGREMLFDYAWQLAAYALACTETLGEPVLPGGLLRVRGYAWNTRCQWNRDAPSTAPVQFATPWSLAHCREMMDDAEALLELIDAGTVIRTPGEACRYCPGEAPHLCRRLLEERFG